MTEISHFVIIMELLAKYITRIYKYVMDRATGKDPLQGKVLSLQVSQVCRLYFVPFLFYNK